MKFARIFREYAREIALFSVFCLSAQNAISFSGQALSEPAEDAYSVLSGSNWVKGPYF